MYRVTITICCKRPIISKFKLESIYAPNSVTGPCDDKYKQSNTNSAPRAADILNDRHSNQSNTAILATLLQTPTST